MTCWGRVEGLGQVGVFVIKYQSDLNDTILSQAYGLLSLHATTKIQKLPHSPEFIHK